MLTVITITAKLEAITIAAMTIPAIAPTESNVSSLVITVVVLDVALAVTGTKLNESK